MQKYRSSDIKSFEFSALEGTHVVSNGDFKAFTFGELTGEAAKSENITEDSLRSERTFERENNFKIDGTVRDSRGLTRQEHSDYEKKIEDEVARRLELVKQAAYVEGIEKGEIEGKAEAFALYQEELAQKVEAFGVLVDGMQSQGDKILKKNRSELYGFIKKFTKWIILKEINEKVYLENLLEKLILELNARKNLIIKISKSSLEDMPEVIEHVEAKLGQLSNLRVEVVSEIQHPGIIIESENGLIDGSMEGVFQNIDKIFEQVISHE